MMTKDEVLAYARKLSSVELSELIDELIDIYDDTPDETILADFREAWGQIVSGDRRGFRSAREFLEELESEDDNGN